MIATERSAATSSVKPDSLRQVCLLELRNLLHTQTGWIKVHAAEYLLWANEPASVREVYLEELRRFENESPYRIGIWRVLAQAATDTAEKNKWIVRITTAFINPDGPDRVHAAESLAKLGVSPMSLDRKVTQEALVSPNGALALYTLWGTTLSDDATSVTSKRSKFLEMALNQHEDVAIRRLSAFILRRLGDLNVADWTKLANATLIEPVSSGIRVNLLHAAIVTSPASEKQTIPYYQLRTELLAVHSTSLTSDLLELIAALSQKGESTDVVVLLPYLKHENADVRAGAAYAVLKIIQRK
ncbi:hypothetical protein IC229_22980 [Spirosoma sp. BT702]|uniref:HEAT repeat domain-containing protein n=1 Tax=Spirosoma profusum TaxID=2771354 RepID=A0A927AS97_9BACT|nr:hypothetical protein [Spirosoma profusum]MBD2703528.1 hypothetical protein [Spirosoma profusum]